MRHATPRGTEDIPNARGVIGWVLFTWVSSAVGAVLLAFAGNWAAALYAVNAAICAAGWFLSASRWAEWRAIAIGLLPRTDGRP